MRRIVGEWRSMWATVFYFEFETLTLTRKRRDVKNLPPEQQELVKMKQLEAQRKYRERCVFVILLY